MSELDIKFVHRSSHIISGRGFIAAGRMEGENWESVRTGMELELSDGSTLPITGVEMMRKGFHVSNLVGLILRGGKEDLFTEGATYRIVKK
jgi:hypothetical protein